MSDNLFGQLVNISKASAYDILADQRVELLKEIKELREALTEGREFIVDNMDKLPNSQEIRLKMLKAINYTKK